MLNQKPNLGAIGESRVQRVPPEAPAVERNALLSVLEKIVAETMDYPPTTPTSADSWIPRDLVAEAQGAITAVRGFSVPSGVDPAK